MAAKRSGCSGAYGGGVGRFGECPGVGSQGGRGGNQHRPTPEGVRQPLLGLNSWPPGNTTRIALAAGAVSDLPAKGQAHSSRAHELDSAQGRRVWTELLHLS